MSPGDSSNPPECYQAYFDYLKDADPIVVLGCGRGDFLRLLVSEGIQAQGVETDSNLVDFCRERELPVVQGGYQAYLDKIEDSSMGGIFLSPPSDLTARDLTPLLASCWISLTRKASRRLFRPVGQRRWQWRASLSRTPSLWTFICRIATAGACWSD